MLKLLPLLLLIYPLYQLYKFYLDHKSHKRKMKNILDWGDFNKQCVKWSDEIKDKSVKDEYVKYIYDEMVIFNNYVFDVDKSRQEIVDKFGKHIPSLLIEVRDEKIDEILANESN
jgi:hypothetical protein